NVRLVELCTLQTIVVLKGVSGIRSVVLDKTPDLFQRSPQNYPKCGNPVDGHYCKGCALLRKKFKEDLFTYCIENEIVQDASKSSNDNTNVVNALQESFVVKQDPGENSSQNGNSFTYDSTSNLVHKSPNDFNPPLQPPTYSYEFYGNDAYYGHDFSLQVPFTYDPEPGPHMNFQCQPMNQNHYEPNLCYDSNSFGFDQFQPPHFPVIHQPIREKTCAELLAEEQVANINTQPFQYSVVPQPSQEEMSVELLQEKRNQINSVKTFLRKFNRISFYEMPKVLSLGGETILEIELAFGTSIVNRRISENRPIVCYYNDDDEDYAIAVIPSLSTEEPDNSLSMGDEHLDNILAIESDEFIKSSVENLVSILSESEGIPNNMCDVPFHDNSPPLDVSKDQFEDFSDSNDESTSTDDNSFSIDNIEYVEASPPNSKLVSSEVIEIVIPEVGWIDDDIFLIIKDDILHEKLLNVNLLIANIEALNDNPTPSSDFMTKSSSTSLNSLLEETNTFDNSLPEFEIFCFDLEEISSGKITSGSTTTHSDSSLYDSFIFDLSINPFPPADRSDFYEFADELAHIISPSEYDCFCFKNEPNSGDFTMNVVEDIFPTREPRVHNALPTHPTLHLNLDFILSSESLFTYVVWIFLPFLLYSVAPQYLPSFGNEDTIFDPGISSYHISSLMLDISHWSGTLIKFKVLNESLMEISFSTCSPMDQ
nr:hypothetical protein [Tanacetum cinerariifolium]